MRRIELGDFLLIAEIHTGIDASQLARIPRVIALGEAALAAPFAGFGDYEAFPALHERAAVYCSRIATYHPLPDGNKRTAYDVMREFLDRNGARFAHPPEGLDGTARAIEDLAASVLSERDFGAWVLERIGGRRLVRPR
ncbi:MAG TPA: type II toxin-antitoxin system death-on-curing family toxin [Solirubrobacteraceae bacterium]|nr:type II toxin-antitoxin system death-on-curing family toxin [Solirubrobacteraceae bacterium]